MIHTEMEGQKMNEAMQTEIKERYIAATESFVDNVRDDPNIIAVIVCGSLAYDTVWEKSDIDMTLIVRDMTLHQYSYCIVENGITINVQLMIRSGFKRGFEKMIGGSFTQSYFAKGQIVYTTDDSLYEYFEEFKHIGSQDIAKTMLWISCELIDIYHKSQKWLSVKKDPLYAQYYLLKAADLMAKMEVCSRGEVPTRESILKIVDNPPAWLDTLYTNAMSRRYGVLEIQEAIGQIIQYLDRQLGVLSQPIIQFMADHEIKTVTLFVKHFQIEGHLFINILEYLADKGIIEKVSQTIRITPKSKPAVEEIGYLYIS